MKILITGASSGIGFDSGLALSRRGHEVTLGVHREEQVSSTLEKIDIYREKMACICFDVTDREALEKLDLGQFDCIVCNAAIGIGGSLLDLPVEKVRENFEVNYFSTLEIVKKVAAAWKRGERSGTVVVMASLAGLLPVPFLGSYCSTKAALIMMMECLWQELFLARSKTRVKLVEPGLYHTGFNQVMLENKEPYLEKSVYFGPESRSWMEFENACVTLIEKTKTNSIVKQVVKAVESTSPRLKYRAPLMQVLSTKLSLLLFK